MPAVDVGTHRFRLAYAHLWLQAGIAHLLLLALCVLSIYLAGLQVDPIWMVVMCIIPSFYWIVYSLKFRLTVSSAGLGWINSSGVDCSLPWSDIEKAELHNSLGLPVLKI